MLDAIRPLSDADTLLPPREVRRGGEERRPAPEPARSPGAEEQKLFVKLPGRDDPRLGRIELLLTMFPGNQQLVIWCEKEKKRIGARCLIHEGLLLELQEMLGKENVVLK